MGIGFSLTSSGEVEAMVVVGGYDSANTRRLAEICAQTGTPTYHIETDEELDLAALSEVIDWTPIFRTWQLKGSFPSIFDKPEVGPQARALFDDAQAMLRQIVDEGWLQAKASFGIFPAASDGDDLAVQGPAGEVRLHTLRQQADKPPGRPNMALADFVAPVGGPSDHIGAFVVTAGLGIEPHLARFQADHDDYKSILLKALADRFAEAAAEWLHRHLRTEVWSYAESESLDNATLTLRILSRLRQRSATSCARLASCASRSFSRFNVSFLRAISFARDSRFFSRFCSRRTWRCFHYT